MLLSRQLCILFRSLSAWFISLLRVLFRQILFVRIAARAGLALLVGRHTALVGALLVLGFSFLAAGEFLRGLGGLRGSEGEEKRTNQSYQQ